MYHLIAKDKVAEQYILGKYYKCNRFGVTKALLNSKNSKYYSAIQCATGVTLYYVITYKTASEIGIPHSTMTYRRSETVQRPGY